MNNFIYRLNNVIYKLNNFIYSNIIIISYHSHIWNLLEYVFLMKILDQKWSENFEKITVAQKRVMGDGDFSILFSEQNHISSHTFVETEIFIFHYFNHREISLHSTFLFILTFSSKRPLTFLHAVKFTEDK